MSLQPKGNYTNNRYRGPIESRKIRSAWRDTDLNLSGVRAAYAALEVRLSGLERNSVSDTASANQLDNLLVFMEGALSE